MEYNCLKLKKSPQKIKTVFSCADGLLSDVITALCFAANGTLYAGTEAGLSVFCDGKFSPVKGIDKAVKVLYGCACGKVFASCGSTLYTLDGKKTVDEQHFNEAVVDMCADNTGKLWMVTDSILWLYNGEKFESYSRMEFGGCVAMTATGDTGVYTVSDKVMQILHGKRPSWSVITPGTSSIPTTAVNSLSSDSWGHVWCGSNEGVFIYDGRSYWLGSDKVGAFPKCKITKIVFGNDGTRYIGTDIGLYVENGTKYSFVGAQRWLPAPEVTAIAVAGDSSEYWVGTKKGLSRISLKYMSLEEKAEHYEGVIDSCHNREGYINSCYFEEGKYTNPQVDISDNDGLWSSIYVAAESYRFAVTGSEDAKKRARDSMYAMLKLLSIPGYDGFPARAYRRPGEPDFGDGDIEWHLAKDDKGELEWKGETSSDEMVGHYYAAAIYYDLVADEKEKKDIAAAIVTLTDHILKNDFTLCDADGLPTTWAQWAPYELNGNDTWYWERGINSLEILSFLKTAYHITKDEKYEDKYCELIKKHHYALNTVTYKIHDNHACHIDDKLGFLTIVPLMLYETDAQLLKYYQLGIKYHWDTQRIERCPTWSFIYGALTGDFCDLESAVRTLQEFPLDTVNYIINNTVRPDVELDFSPEEFGGAPQAKDPLPADERPIGRLSYGAFKLDGGNNSSALAPSTWMLPYWMGRYYGLISEA